MGLEFVNIIFDKIKSFEIKLTKFDINKILKSTSISSIYDRYDQDIANIRQDDFDAIPDNEDVNITDGLNEPAIDENLYPKKDLIYFRLHMIQISKKRVGKIICIRMRQIE